MVKLKRKLLLLAFIAGFSCRLVFTFAQVSKIDNTFETQLQGSWSVVSLMIEKNTDGKVETVVVDAFNNVESYLPCPQTWEFRDSTTAVLRFPDGREEGTMYHVEGDRFTIAFLGAFQRYQYVVNDKNLTLTVTHTYMMNQPSGHLATIKEKWMIVLEKNDSP